MVLTSLTMVAFAGNSVICRMALRESTIDPATFTSVRLLAGAVTLAAIFLFVRRGQRLRSHGSWASAFALALYAVCFSYAYVSLSTGTGALILFGFVQATMIAMALWSGDRPQTAEWIGWTAAAAGLVWLLLPGVEAPGAVGAALMALAGELGELLPERDALSSTAANFVMTLPLAAVITLVTFRGVHMTAPGVALAVISGGLTSGVGYVIWYAALAGLTSIQAALVQLSVPAIAAAGGVLLLAEPISMRLLVSGILILGGICLALAGKSAPAESAELP